MIWGVDTAYPSVAPADLVALGYDFVDGYLGGRALHDWTLPDWIEHRNAGLMLGVYWVAPTGTPNYQFGIDAGNQILEAMMGFKLSGIIQLDIENGAIPTDYSLGVVDACHAGSCLVAVYGSYPTIEGMAREAGKWFWDKTILTDPVQSGTRLARALPDWDKWQYSYGPAYDRNVARDDFPFATLNQ